MQGGVKAASCCIREVGFPEFKAALKLWIEGCEAQLQPITGPVIVAKAGRLRIALDLLGNAIKFSNGWVDEFKQHHACNIIKVTVKPAQSILPVLKRSTQGCGMSFKGGI